MGTRNKELVHSIFVPFPDPQGKERDEVHTVFQGKKFIKKYKRTPDKTRKNLDIIKNSVLREFDETDEDSIFEIKIIAKFKRPKRILNDRVEEDILVGKKPDWDNIGKLVCDGLNKLVWKDDAQIAIGRVIKRFVKIKNGKWEKPGIKYIIWKIGRKH